MQGMEGKAKIGGSVYVILWEFLVKPGREAEFEQIYGTSGDWARFFAKSPGYIGTELIRDIRQEGRYVTIDSWLSQADYASFREENPDEYRAIDERCEALTEREAPLGTFVSVS